MIGQTMINVKASGARTRISTFLAGVFLLILVVGLGDVVAVIPMAALVAVMIMVSVGTFDWHSIAPAHPAPDARRRDPGHGRHRRGRPWPRTTSPSASSSASSSPWSVRPPGRALHRRSTPSHRPRRTTPRVYAVIGELFFASSNDLVYQFDYADDPRRRRHRPLRRPLWDASTVAALDAIEHQVRQQGQARTIVGMNEASAERHERLAGHLGGGH